jgi:hypothetical protein
LDDIGLTLQKAEKIATFEGTRSEVGGPARVDSP